MKSGKRWGKVEKTPQAQVTHSDGRYTTLDLHQVPKAPTQASAAAAPSVKLLAADSSAAMVKVVFWHRAERGLHTAPGGLRTASHPSASKASPANSGSEML